MEIDHGSRHFTLVTWHSAANYHSTFALLALADMSQPDSQRGETNAPVAEKRENGEVKFGCSSAPDFRAGDSRPLINRPSSLSAHKAALRRTGGKQREPPLQVTLAPTVCLWRFDTLTACFFWSAKSIADMTSPVAV